MKELTKAYSDLLQDKRVRFEQARYESFTRQRNQVMDKYRRVFQAFNGLIDGLVRAQNFYSEMGDTVESLEKNVETFVSTRRSEGAQLLGQIERDKSRNAGGQADRERDRLRELMERMSVDPSSSLTKSSTPGSPIITRPSDSQDSCSTRSPPPLRYHPGPSPMEDPAVSLNSPAGMGRNHVQQTVVPNNTHAPRESELPQPGRQPSVNDPYNPMVYPFQSPLSPPAAGQGMYYPHQAQPAPQAYVQHGQYLPQGYVPPPPPPGPPPSAQINFGVLDRAYPSGPGGYLHYQPPRQSGGGATQREQHDAWASLNAWK